MLTYFCECTNVKYHAVNELSTLSFLYTVYFSCFYIIFSFNCHNKFCIGKFVPELLIFDGYG